MENAKSLPINPNAQYLANSVSNVLYNIEKVDQRTLGWPKSPKSLKTGRTVRKKTKSNTSIEVPFTHRPSRLINKHGSEKLKTDRSFVKKSNFYKIIRDSQNPFSDRKKRKKESDYDEESLYSDISSIFKRHKKLQDRSNKSKESTDSISQRLEKEIYTGRVEGPYKSNLKVKENTQNNLRKTSHPVKIYSVRVEEPKKSDINVADKSKNKLPKTRLPIGDPNKSSAKPNYMDLYKVRQKVTEPSKKRSKVKKLKKNIVGKKEKKHRKSYNLTETFRPTRMSQRRLTLGSQISLKRISSSVWPFIGPVGATRSDATVIAGDTLPVYMATLDAPKFENTAGIIRLTAERNRRRSSKLSRSSSLASTNTVEDYSERLVKLKQYLSKKNGVNLTFETTSLDVDGINDRDLLLFPYPEIFSKERTTESKRKLDASSHHPEIPTPIRQIPFKQKAPEAESKPKKKMDSCSFCKLIHSKEPEKEAPFLEEMRKEQARNELLAYRANLSKYLKTPVKEKLRAHALDIHDVQYQSYFKLEDKEIDFSKAKPLSQKHYQVNLCKKNNPRTFFAEIDLNSAFQAKG
nr:uncharacterized protein LOC108130120 [Drosophila bipectinata]